MSTQWILIQPSEDGDPVRYLKPGELEELLADPSDWGVCEFLTEVPERTDSNYWKQGTALLLRAEIVAPRPVTTSWELP